MILDTPARSLQIVLGEAHTTTACDLVACYGEQTAAGGFVTALAHAASNGTTPVTMVSAPPPTTQYLVNEVRLHNADSVSHTVTLRLLDGATTRSVYSGSVASGADWVYTPEVGAAAAGSGSATLAGDSDVSLTSPASGQALIYNGSRWANATVLSSTTPAMNGVAAIGTATTMARADHVHATDTSLAPLASPSFSGTVNLGSGSLTGTALSTYFASPPSIGSTAAAAGSFTTLSASSTVSGTGFTNRFASPGPIGSTSASTGAFTTLSASSTISGTGFSTYLASPPAIGGTAAAAVSATTLSASSTVSGTGFSTYLASPPAIGTTTPANGQFVNLTATGFLALTAPNTITASSYTVAGTDFAIIANVAGSLTLTLPSGTNQNGRMLLVKTITTNAVSSATSNVIQRASTTVSTAMIAAGTAGAWVLMVYNASSGWVIMAGS